MKQFLLTWTAKHSSFCQIFDVPQVLGPMIFPSLRAFYATSSNVMKRSSFSEASQLLEATARCRRSKTLEVVCGSVCMSMSTSSLSEISDFKSCYQEEAPRPEVATWPVE